VPVGHSFGGAVMLSTVRSGKLAHARRFVLSSPALKLKAKVPAWKTSLGKVMANVAPRLAIENEVDAGTVSRIPEVVAAYRADPLVHGKISSRLYAEWQRAARENIEHAGDIKIPFLILAGTADRLIDFEGSRQLHERAPAMSELRLLEGRYHEPFNDLGDEEVFALIAEWLGK
jgi:acylglycerol lipase